MMTPRQVVARGFLVGVLAAVLGVGACFAYIAWYVGTDRILQGVTVGPAAVGGLRPREARARLTGADQHLPPGPVLAGGAPGLGGGAPVGGTLGPEPRPAWPEQDGAVALLRWEEKTWALPLKEVGPVPDVPGALKQAAAIGRGGPLWYRVRVFLAGIVHGHHVTLKSAVREEALAARLEAIGREVNRPAQDARWDAETDTYTAETDGLALDMEASLAAVRRAVLASQSEVELVVRPVPPAVRRQDLAQARQYQLAQFTSPILAADPGRVQNIGIAIKKISGRVIKPGEVFSFNEIVGPRDAEHGWAQANELYQGEFVLGYGGGICQVSSTLYNAVLLAGLEVKERYHHDRPLQYVDPGRDATVAWNLLDFKFRNNTDTPVLLVSRVLPDTPQRIEVSFYGPSPAPVAGIRLEEAEVRYFPPPMVEVFESNLPVNTRKVIDEGHYGIEVSIYRVFPKGQGERRELVSRDRYEPKPGKVKVGVGHAPGNQ
jgi:vancomycin resistance protein YoaR